MLSGLYSALPLHPAAMIAFAVAVLSLSSPVCADDQIDDPWVATWGASPSIELPPITFDNQSVRQIALVTIGGRGQRLRIRLSNELGAEDVIVGAAHIGLASYFPAQKAVFGRPCNESGRADPPAGRSRQVVK
jgi:hypothetical protein